MSTSAPGAGKSTAVRQAAGRLTQRLLEYAANSPATLLAIERLPARRADPLQAVVTDVIARHEVPRQGGRRLESLTADSVGTAAMHAYATEATTIHDQGGIATIEEVTTAVAATLRELWGLPPGPARTAAVGAVRFLDETGVFVLSEPDGTVERLRCRVAAAVGRHHCAPNAFAASSR